MISFIHRLETRITFLALELLFRLTRLISCSLLPPVKASPHLSLPSNVASATPFSRSSLGRTNGAFRQQPHRATTGHNSPIITTLVGDYDNRLRQTILSQTYHCSNFICSSRMGFSANSFPYSNECSFFHSSCSSGASFLLSISFFSHTPGALNFFFFCLSILPLSKGFNTFEILKGQWGLMFGPGHGILSFYGDGKT